MSEVNKEFFDSVKEDIKNGFIISDDLLKIHEINLNPSSNVYDKVNTSDIIKSSSLVEVIGSEPNSSLQQPVVYFGIVFVIIWFLALMIVLLSKASRKPKIRAKRYYENDYY